MWGNLKFVLPQVDEDVRSALSLNTDPLMSEDRNASFLRKKKVVLDDEFIFRFFMACWKAAPAAAIT
jgi:hypothetical protein